MGFWQAPDIGSKRLQNSTQDTTRASFSRKTRFWGRWNATRPPWHRKLVKESSRPGKHVATHKTSVFSKPTLSLFCVLFSQTELFSLQSSRSCGKSWLVGVQSDPSANNSLRRWVKANITEKCSKKTQTPRVLNSQLFAQSLQSLCSVSCFRWRSLFLVNACARTLRPCRSLHKALEREHKTESTKQWIVCPHTVFICNGFARLCTCFSQFSLPGTLPSVLKVRKTCSPWRTGPSVVSWWVLGEFWAEIGSLPKSHNLA